MYIIYKYIRGLASTDCCDSKNTARANYCVHIQKFGQDKFLYFTECFARTNCWVRIQRFGRDKWLCKYSEVWPGQIDVIQGLLCQDNVAAPTQPTEMDEVRRQLEDTHQQLLTQLQELSIKTQVMSPVHDDDNNRLFLAPHLR